MTDDLRKQIYLNFSQSETEELLEIWSTNDRYEWSEIAFDVIREILQERQIELPPQGEPSYQARRLMPDAAGEGPQARDFDSLLQGEYFDEADTSRPGVKDFTGRPLRKGRTIGVHGTLRRRHQEAAEIAAPLSEQKNLEGLGGWLILVGFGVILSPLVIIAQLLQAYSGIVTTGNWEAITTPGSAVYHPFFGPLLIAEIVFTVGMLLVRLALIFLFFAKKRAFPKWFIGITLFGLLYSVVDVLAFKAIWPSTELLNWTTVGQFVRSAATALIWVAYMLRSKRVKATFVK